MEEKLFDLHDSNHRNMSSEEVKQPTLTRVLEVK
jgi:hypothetical protein